MEATPLTAAALLTGAYLLAKTNSHDRRAWAADARFAGRVEGTSFADLDYADIVDSYTRVQRMLLARSAVITRKTQVLRAQLAECDAANERLAQLINDYAATGSAQMPATLSELLAALDRIADPEQLRELRLNAVADALSTQHGRTILELPRISPNSDDVIFWDASVSRPALYLVTRVPVRTSAEKKAGTCHYHTYTDLARYGGGIIHTSGLGYVGLVVTFPSTLTSFRLWIAGRVYYPQQARWIGLCSTGSPNVSVVSLPFSSASKLHNGDLVSAPTVAAALGATAEISRHIFQRRVVFRPARRIVSYRRAHPVLVYSGYAEINFGNTEPANAIIAVDCHTSGASGTEADAAVALAIVGMGSISHADLRCAIQPLPSGVTVAQPSYSLTDVLGSYVKTTCTFSRSGLVGGEEVVGPWPVFDGSVVSSAICKTALAWPYAYSNGPVSDAGFEYDTEDD